MDGHLAFGYKVTYQWVLNRAKEIGIEPEDDSARARTDVMMKLLTKLAIRVGLLRQVRPISVKGKDVIAFCIASTDPGDGLPRRVTDADKVEKLRQLVGADGPPNWWRQD
ncbi:uncharacterized protein PHACADRAFT_266513 [Phanerochaete carnosa HHB-10118-sp]|uniref:Uncharacterized protein n=1 Tax=Phanerochaete carnosa (strain HHB-10118-sp) TaxID=650164 RepID=K5VAS7_PHACS|nr:uncharacterized protein PHACADRAFT_266513 [Phanerochaete carnosa HHB-10118-sp]EKM48183.1 hypothetical protein PHACADRAFT_266513 [Phanerochaete carnosa HHB-10118-sp]